MHDFKSYSSAEQNPIVSKAFVKTLSPYELLQILDNSSENNREDFDARKYIIDCEAVIDGIIESGCEGKLLILATRSDLGWSRTSEFINLFFSKGKLFQSALLSNSRINWYNFFARDESGFLEKNLDLIIDKNSDLAPMFYRNPRMDRKLISHIIRGKKVKFWDSQYDFSKIALQQRIDAVYYSLPAKKIKTNYDNDFYGMPSSNDMDFCKPIEASIFLIKDLSNRMSYEKLSQCLSYLEWIIADQDFSYDPEDWLTESEYIEFNKSGDFQSTWKKTRYLAFGRIIIFFNEITKNIKSKYEGDANSSSYYTLAFLSIVILSSLIRNYQNSSNFDENTSILLKSDNWVLRAAAYSALINNISINEAGWSEFKNFLDQAKKDPYASAHGIKMSKAYYLFKYINGDYHFNHVSVSLNYHFESIDFPESLTEYFDRLSCIFDSYRNKNDFSKCIEEHNQRVIRISKEEKASPGIFKKITGMFSFSE